jgi:predicted dehydrogenase
MATEPVRLGFVGAGFFGQVAHLRNYSQLEACQVVALAELRDDLRQKVADKFSIPHRFATHQELLDQADVEAVVVVTARSAMGPIVRDCLQAGKHVLSEKPIAGTSELAGQLCQAARRQGVLYSVGYMKRYDAGVQAARQLLQHLLATGELGAVTYARAHCFAGDAYCGEKDYVRSEHPVPPGLQQWPLAPDWLAADQRASYDQYLNTYCHNIDLLRYLLGEPRLHSAMLRQNNGLAVLSCDGVPVLLETGRVEHSGWDESVQVFMERGWLTIQTPAPLLRDVPASVELYRGGDASRTERLELPSSWAFRRQAEAFLADVRHGRSTANSCEDAHRDVHLVEEIWRTALAL